MVKTRIAKKTTGPDYILLSTVAFLVVWGVFTVGTISFPLALERYGNPWHYLLHQLIMLGVGIALGFVCFKTHLETFKKLAPYLFLINLIAVGLVFLPQIGVKMGGARRWLNFGAFLVQPAEFLKITFALYLASWLSAREELGKYKKNNQNLAIHQLFLPFLVILAILLFLLILQPDMTTLVLVCLIGVSMYFIAQTPWWQTFLLIISGLGGGLLLIKITPYRAARLLTFLKPETDPLGIGYQLRQAAIAVGSGRIFGIEQGLAFGLSRQKFGFLPQPMTDSIFAIIGEELGFVGGAFLILTFLFFAGQGIRIVLRSKRQFERFLALGIVVWLFSQAFLNIGGTIGIIPMGGIPLPFFSYGGSHILAEITGIGLLLNISRKSLNI